MMKKKVENYMEYKLDSEGSEDEWQFNKTTIDRNINHNKQSNKSIRI